MRIMVPVDGTSESEEAIPVAARLAEIFGADMCLARVVETIDAFSPLRSQPDVAARLNETADYLHALVERQGLPEQTKCLAVKGDNVAKALGGLARDEEINLIVMRRRTRRGLQRRTQGSVWNRLVRAKVCSVLVVPPAVTAEEAARSRGRREGPWPIPETGASAPAQRARELMGW
ncbi:MAG: universal stress protein [Dehalococcoidia bacterium]|nr:universal stress protein [Dehalococcoidia bacterium]